MNMKLSLSTLFIVLVIVFFSIFIANLSNLIAIHWEGAILQEGNVSRMPKESAVLADGREHLMWFLQVSDLHISIFHEQTRIEQFRHFCQDVVPAIGPAVVIATGDLTDAKTADNMGSAQQLQEWLIYSRILNETGVARTTAWLDIRGNHDNFNIPDNKSHLHYYRKYSVQGRHHPHSYIHISDINGDRYAFLGIDACLNPGPKRPFNFIGMLTHNETRHVRDLIKFAQGSGVEYTISFGHYPTSSILSEQGTVRQMITEAPGGWLYLCGHYHMLGGLVPNMYTLQQTGLLELELADWKENRMYRVGVLDHGLFSFADVQYGTWPVIVVTNPKHALFMVPSMESSDWISRSTHIRLLVFSVSPVEIVQVAVDGGSWRNASRVPGHPALYVVSWNPSAYQAGVHELHVRARDSMTREQSISQPFSLDGTRLSFGFWPRVTLMSNVSMLFQSLFGLGICVAVVPLCVFRMLHHSVVRGQSSRPHIRSRTLRRWARQLWLTAAVDRLFYPLVIYPLYLSVGPWTIGEIIDGHIGAVFAWGMIVNGAYLPGSFTYAYGFLHIVSFQLPLTLIIAYDLDKRFSKDGSVSERRLISWHRLPFYIVMLIQCMGAYFFWLAYGNLAFLLGPLRTWSIVLALVLWYYANTLPVQLFKELKPIWQLRSGSVPEY